MNVDKIPMFLIKFTKSFVEMFNQNYFVTGKSYINNLMLINSTYDLF